METKLKLDKKRSRVKFCPCGKSNKDGKFVPFVGFDDKGYCHSCGETFFPDGEKKSNTKPISYVQPPPPKQPTFIDNELVNQSMKGYDQNIFVDYIRTLFEKNVVETLINLYKIGSSKHWPGATIFWQSDINGNYRSGKVMLFDNTGHRVKKPKDHITWVHAIMKTKNFTLQQCLFGEHLLKKYPEKTVCIVESEKTAIICAGLLPQYLWLSVGGKDALKPDRLNPVLNRKIVLFPDLNGYELWKTKAAELKDFDISVSDLLQRKAPQEHIEQGKGFDVADYLTEIQTTKQKEKQILVSIVAETKHNDWSVSTTKNAIPKSWNKEIVELEKFFENIELPTQPMQLNNHSTITDIANYLESHFATVKANNGKPTFLPYLERLQELMRVMQPRN